MAASPAVAECYDAPMWRGEPLTQAYIVQEIEAGADPIRVAHLRLIAAYPNQMAARRANAFQRIIPQVLLHYEGDRAAAGRELRAGNMALLLEIADIENLRFRGPDAAEHLLWYNGCAREAVGRLVRDDDLSFVTVHMVLALADPEILQSVSNYFASAAEQYDRAHLSYHALRYRTFAAMIRTPNAAAEHMATHLTDLEGILEYGVRVEDTRDYVAITYALAALTDTALPPMPTPPPERSGPFWQAYLQSVAEIPVWTALSGQCAEAQRFIWPLMPEIGPESYGWEWNVQSVAILCGAQAASPG